MNSNILRYFLISQSVLLLISCEATNRFTLDRDMQDSISLVNIANKFSSGNLAGSPSSACAKQLTELIDHYEDALLKMADAWSKFPYTGLLYASRTDYGNYDECISVKVQTTTGSILGKHCTYGLVVPDVTLSNSTEMVEKAWKLSYCIPHLCTAEDLKNMTGLSLFNDAICSTQESDMHLDMGAKITLVTFIIFILFMTATTIYDLSCYRTKRKGHFIFTAFSLHANGKRLLSVEKHSNEQVLCFNGIKFISMWWIMSGHSATAWTAIPVMDDDWRTKWQHLNYSQYIMTAHLAVDSFFYISGFLLAYLYFKNELSKKSYIMQIKAVPSMVIHRYLRLTPAVVMTFLFVVYLYRYTGNGPLFSYRVNGALTEPCKNHWWAVFSYIQNYYIFHLGEELCITPLWYVSADMQLFIVAPLIIIPVAMLYRRSFKVALASLFGLNLLFIGVPIFSKLKWREYDPEFSEYDAHSRLVDYFIGVMMGVYLRHERAKNIRINRKINIFIWITALAAMLGVVLVTQEVNLNYGYISKTLCYSISRPIWCLGLCWITYACFTGHGGFINWLLSNPFMQIGGKLTYCLYLVHGPIITHYTLTVKNRKNFSDYYLFYEWAGHFVISMLFATFWTLAFELPMITIQKVIFSNRTNKPTETRFNK